LRPVIHSLMIFPWQQYSNTKRDIPAKWIILFH
jgi:hypothetical protein